MPWHCLLLCCSCCAKTCFVSLICSRKQGYCDSHY
jgi:hypothetical protein